jgi:hypothetical protein
MQEKLQGCDAWLCFDCDSTKIKEQVDVAKAAGIKSLVVTSTMSAADAKAASVLEAFEVSLSCIICHVVECYCSGVLLFRSANRVCLDCVRVCRALMFVVLSATVRALNVFCDISSGV